MFHAEFFPTPNWLAEEMLSRVNLNKVHSILEPSAGKGDLIEAIRDKTHRPRLACCEIDPELQLILSGKGVPILNDDFLSFSGQGYYFDLIVMNPPFSQGARHLLHAWSLLSDGQVLCLLNAETIRNPYTEERQLLLKLIADYGQVQFFPRAFADAERSTEVDVALVHLHKVQAAASSEAWMDSLHRVQPDPVEDFAAAFSAGTALQNPDFIRNRVAWHRDALQAFRDLLDCYQRLSYYTQPLLQGCNYTLSSIIETALKEPLPQLGLTTFNVAITKRAWQSLFQQTQFEKVLTARMQNNFAKHGELQGQRSFRRRTFVHCWSY